MQWLIAIGGILAMVATLVGLIITLMGKWPFHE